MAKLYAERIPSLIGNSIGRLMLEGSRDSIKSMISEIVDDNLVLGIHVFDKDGHLRCGCISSQDQFSRCNDDSFHYQAGYIEQISSNFQLKEFSLEVSLDKLKFISFYKPYYNEPKCMNCHPATDKVLGVLNVNIDVSEFMNFFNDKMQRVRKIMIIFSIVLTALISLLVNYLIIKPIHKLEAGMEAVSEGDLATYVVINSNDELEHVAEYFNRMVYSLNKVNSQIDKIHQNMIHSDRLMTIGQLMASISHEIKNPLNSIMITADILQMKCADEEKKKQLGHYLENIVEDSTRIQHIVDQTLSFSRIGKHDIDEICVDDFMRSIEAYAERIIFSSDNVRFEVQKIDSLCEYTIRFNRVSLEQIIVNILKNAVESIDDDKNGFVSVAVSREKDNIIFQIEDNGSGISALAKEHIFEEFYTTKKSGTGLGLSIAKNFIEEFDGTIKFESEEGKGTLFTISLPASNDKDVSI